MARWWVSLRRTVSLSHASGPYAVFFESENKTVQSWERSFQLYVRLFGFACVPTIVSFASWCIPATTDIKGSLLSLESDVDRGCSVSRHKCSFQAFRRVSQWMPHVEVMYIVFWEECTRAGVFLEPETFFLRVHSSYCSRVFWYYILTGREKHRSPSCGFLFVSTRGFLARENSEMQAILRYFRFEMSSRTRTERGAVHVWSELPFM
jgi:hypothetical protein